MGKKASQMTASPRTWRKTFHYLTSRFDVPPQDMPGLTNMIRNACQINLEGFRRHCHTADWERRMGYSRIRGSGLLLRNDWHVRYYRSAWKGRPCYYAVHSAIEYIWVQEPVQGEPTAVLDDGQAVGAGE